VGAFMVVKNAVINWTNKTNLNGTKMKPFRRRLVYRAKKTRGGEKNKKL